MIFSVLSLDTSAIERKQDKKLELSEKDAIIQNYQNLLLSANTNLAAPASQENSRGMAPNRSYDVQTIQANAVEALNEAGYHAYDVNPQSYNAVEASLDTNLQQAGLSPDGTYMILVEGDDDTYGTTSPSFSHTFEGTTYTMRWFTVYASDDPRMTHASTVSILDEDEKIRAVIQHCLDASFDICVGAVSEPLGTLKTILGIDISDFMADFDSHIDYRAASNWTRRYTQVYDSYQQMWFSCCCVEESAASSTVITWVYDYALNAFVQEIEPIELRRFYSDRFYDYEWRKDIAASYFYNYAICWDTVGDVEYYYDGKVIIRHRENF